MRLDRPLRFAALLAFEVLAVVALVRLGRQPYVQVGWADLGAWLGVTPPDDVLVALCRLVALVCALWLLATTVLYGVAVAAAVPSAIRAAQWVTPPVVRRMVDGALAAALVSTGVVSTPGIAAAQPETVAPVPAGFALPAPLPVPRYRPVPAADGDTPAVRDEPLTRPGPASEPAAIPAPEAADPRPPRSPALGEPGEPPASDVHVVVAGDSLWRIAVAQVGDDDAARLHAYWRELVATNRARLRSGDPDLIYPGERLRLPPVPPPA